jgi:hypothetical protein
MVAMKDSLPTRATARAARDVIASRGPGGLPYPGGIGRVLRGNGRPARRS